MKQTYLTLIALIERLHREFLEVVGTELDRLRIHDINNVQALILFNLGGAELTVGELTLRGCYLGSNVSYNLKKMVENDYLIQERSAHDRRSVRVRLSEKGFALTAHLDAMHERHLRELADRNIEPETIDQINATLHRLDRFWIGMVERNNWLDGKQPSTAA